VVFRRGGFFAGVKKRRATTMVGGDELTFGPISGKKSCCDPSILEYSAGFEKARLRVRQLPSKTKHMFQPSPVKTVSSKYR
jgi:hypothetical protein